MPDEFIVIVLFVFVEIFGIPSQINVKIIGNNCIDDVIHNPDEAQTGPLYNNDKLQSCFFNRQMAS